MNPAVLLILYFFIFCLLRVPIPYTLGISSLLIILQCDISLRQVVLHMMRGVDIFPLVAIPFFMFLGEIMNKSDITDRLLLFSRGIVGHIRGGLAHIVIVGEMFLSGISGSSTADTAAIGSVMIPTMIRSGYPDRFSVAVVAMATTLGNVIPPAIYMVVYGAMSGISIGAMFLAGVVPGILIGLSQIGVAYYIARKQNFPAEAPMTWSERLQAGRKASLTLVIPVMIIGGIISGFFTPTEAAAFVVVFALFLSLFVYKSLSWREIPNALLQSGLTSALPCFTVACAAIFGWLLGYLQVPNFVGAQIEAVSTNPLVVVAVLIAFLLVLGTFLSEIATIIIFMPIFQKVGEIAHLDPIHLGMIVILLLCLGLVTPPYGICLLISCGIGKVDVLSAFRDCFWFIIVYIGVVWLVVLFPALSLWLPKLLLPQFV
jgi:tripartite ATP-independent transporter DctM subunit